jgi:hypothetical protein
MNENQPPLDVYDTLGTTPPPLKPPPKEYTAPERRLLLIALAIGVLFDRLLLTSGFSEGWSVFWLCYLVLFCVFFWKRLKHDMILWVIAGFSAALCVWGLIYSGSYEYRTITGIVIPGVLMGHAVMTAGAFKLKDAGGIAAAWVYGWCMPFLGFPALGGSVGSLASRGRRPYIKKAAIGAGITLLLLCILLPLLAGADLMFGHYMERIFQNWNLSSFVWHSIVVLIAFALFYSFFWMVGFGKKITAPPMTARIDKVICCVVLGSVTLLYLIFLGVQYTYLFGFAALPEGMTNAEYVRSGFSQTVAVCIINFAVFGVFLRFTQKDKTVTVLLSGLLGLTGLMLINGFTRLVFYVGDFGLTWIRLLSAWFYVYLAAVLILCFIRLIKEKLPLIAVCALLLLGWYVVLGYSGPDKLIKSYNQNIWHGEYICFERCPAVGCLKHTVMD